MEHKIKRLFLFLISFILFYLILFFIIYMIKDPPSAYYRSSFFEYLIAAIFISAFAAKGYWFALTLFGIGTLSGQVICLMVVARQKPYVTMKGGLLALLLQVASFVVAAIIQTIWVKYTRRKTNKNEKSM